MIVASWGRDYYLLNLSSPPLVLTWSSLISEILKEIEFTALVAGSCRSFPQDSRNSHQFYEVKRMISVRGAEMASHDSQTLNV